MGKDDPKEKEPTEDSNDPQGKSGKTPTGSAQFKSAMRKWRLEVAEAELVLKNPAPYECEKLLYELKPVLDHLKSCASNDDSEELVMAEIQKYNELRVLCNEGMKKDSETAKPKIKLQLSEQQNLMHFTKMKMPKFDGKIRHYMRFKKNFRQLVEARIQDDLICHTRLVEEALDPGSLEQNIALSRNTMREVWHELDRIFGHPSAIRDAILLDISKIAVIRNMSDHIGLRRLVTELIAARENLIVSGLDASIIGDCAFSAMMLKLPTEIRTEIDMAIYKDSLCPKRSIEVLISTCEKFAIINEMHQLRADVNISQQSSTQVSLKPTQPQPIGQLSENETLAVTTTTSEASYGQRKPERKRSCLVHPKLDSHDTYQCIKFTLEMSPEEQKCLILDNKGCLRCLRTNHGTEDCKTNIMCKLQGCKNPDKHASMLHNACLSAVLTSQVDMLVKPPSTQGEMRELQQHLGGTTVRPSHHVYANSGPKRQQLNALYDTGATLSQITESAASRCGLTPVNSLSNLVMATAGNPSVDWGKSDLFKVPLYDETGNLVAVIKCVQVKYIGRLDSGSYEKVAELFEGQNPNKLLPPVSGEIDLLIGNNHASIFPQPVQTVGDVIWAETYFGDILHGSHHLLPAAKDVPQSLLCEAAMEAYARSLVVSRNSNAPNQSRADKNVNCGDCRDTCRDMQELNSIVENDHLVMDTGRCSCPSINIAQADLFEKIVAIEDQPVCYRCGKCPVSTSNLTKEEERRLAVYNECLKYNEEEKRFYTKMPWLENYQELPNNKSAALKRLTSLTKNMAKTEHDKNLYIEEFNKIIAKGVLVEVTEDEDTEWTRAGNKVWYVSHFGVKNESSVSTPYRIVFDPTTPFKGILLGALWEDPPNLIPQIAMLTVKFREKAVPVAMDISKAYWSVFLELEESHLHRCVWNELNENKPVTMFRMLCNSWGMKPAGALCSLAMQILAKKYQEAYPHVHEFLMNSLYVDDGTTSVETQAEAIKLAVDTSKVLEAGSFGVKHFIIGGRRFDVDNPDIPEHVRSAQDTERVLGILWHPTSDTISINGRVNFSKKKHGANMESSISEDEFHDRFPEKLTLRQYVSVISTPYDPDGLTTPITILLRAELGPLFALNLGWDAPLPDPEKERCKKLIQSIYGLQQVQFSRCLRSPDIQSDRPVLIIFADSSQVSYACVAYYNWACLNGDRKSVLVKAKAKPIPRKGPILYKIPRSELMAMVLAARMKEFLVETSSYTFEQILLITDSTIALGQCQYEPCKLNTWVANRVDEIQHKTGIDTWYHVASEDNIADIATRGAAPDEIGPDSRWQCGADFMKKPIKDWPLTPANKVSDFSTKNVDIEARIRDPRLALPNSTLMQSTKVDTVDESTLKILESLNIGDLDPNDTLVRAKRRLARVIRFIELPNHWLGTDRGKDHVPTPPDFSKWDKRRQSQWINEHDKFVPTQRELELGEKYLVLRAQTNYLPERIEHKYSDINARKDEDCIWRAYGRTAEVCEPLIIVPHESPLATVLLRHSHVPAHCGGDTTLSKVREKYWITNGRRTANKFCNSCAFCRYLKKKNNQPIMAPVKEEQCKRSPVFETVAIDIAGPYMTKADRRATRAYNASAGKVWVLLIMCRSSRAVHLETMEGYDTASLLAAFDAFTQVRATPRSVLADMGSQIVGAAGTLESVWRCADPSKLRNYLPGEIEWNFIPSGAHHFLGSAERMVQVFKRTMEAVTRSKTPELPKLEFQRLLNAIANIINDRPIGIGRVNTGNLSEDRLLRPNDLLLGRSSSSITPLIDYESINELSGDRRKYAELIAKKDAFINRFWSKWYEQVFSSLFPREKWTKTDREVKVGDIVIIRDTNPVRGKWSWGEVVECHPSSDGVVRTATVRYKNRTTGRKDKPTKSKVVVKGARDIVVILPAEEK